MLGFCPFAGAFFNFVLAFVLAVVIIGVVGVDYPHVLKVEEDSAVYKAGLREGDRIRKLMVEEYILVRK